MGQSGSVHRSPKTRRHNLRRISLGGLGRRRSNNSKNLSHTFTFIDGTLKVEQLNLNTATEEELMTLPGITRAIATNIVAHRQAIGRFNRVEDLALVSGVGAHKLESIRLEVYVPSTNGSRTSSRASLSLDSVGNGGSMVDVNTASVFTLQTIPGMNQEVAACIVERRLEKGPYRFLDELAKVQGMGKHRLTMIKPYLRIDVDSNGSITPTPSNDTSSPCWSNPKASSTPVANGIKNLSKQTLKNGISKSLAVSRINGCRNGMEISGCITEEEIWDLLSVASPRPPTPIDFQDRLDNRVTTRVASWNLETFSKDKASNPGVREVICRTILENRLALIALQEIESPDALDALTHELNYPVLKRVRDWRENRRVWRSLHLGAGLAILWDSDPRIGIALREQPPATTVLLPVVASAVFHINKFDVTIINVRIHSADDNKIIEGFCEAKNSILLGDFTLLEESNKLDQVINEGSTAVHPGGTVYNDNILWGKDAEKQFSTGIAGVIRLGLTHLGIPHGWHWGGPVSSHCPVWCQIFTQFRES
ncbi:endonuclease/exonuclease/phosphatase family domain-containing protein 1 isoform X2 [Cephus cinctus]|nr:endonuclease/exonuclease/phosphatase family domain-containing protein 1 isoform X2 [Cephus cinctus]XP_015604853.1 endonuclease/exonuclease/phosphatase family domain-containing protein 1 isoform X2 [Cephus cinctus]XP_015604854.1 endonuclease/exonuclease/phosphatase family domain-containing protein 1 isoform X2 [Cephus cinctus]XP_024945460.1 endonuclease/exonuclease/phosphatase family domain-containing protein 1 isoform X2 [Cephus cinctus]XP_024945461.1 endonuclease/exonuclease/phosphatase fam